MTDLPAGSSGPTGAFRPHSCPHLGLGIFSHGYHFCVNVVDTHAKVRDLVFAKRNLVQAFDAIALMPSQASCVVRSSFLTNEILFLKGEKVGNVFIILLSGSLTVFVTSLSPLLRTLMQASFPTSASWEVRVPCIKISAVPNKGSSQEMTPLPVYLLVKTASRL